MNEPARHAAPDLRGRFTLSETARDRITELVEAYTAWENGERADDPGKIYVDSPLITAGWSNRGLDVGESDVWQLVRYAADNGIITRPDGMDLDFVYVDDSDGGSYHFTVDVGRHLPTQVTLTTWSQEMRKLGLPGMTGVDAAMSVLEEAVTEANGAVDGLQHLISASQPENSQ